MAARQKRDLKNKARILVEEGALLKGALDETGMHTTRAWVLEQIRLRKQAAVTHSGKRTLSYPHMHSQRLTDEKMYFLLFSLGRTRLVNWVFPTEQKDILPWKETYKALKSTIT